MKKNLTRLLTVAFCLTQASISLCPPPAGGPPPAPLLNLTEFSKLSQQEKDEWKGLSRDQQAAELARFKAIIAARSAGGSGTPSTIPSGGKTSPTTPPSTSGAGGGGGGGAAAAPRATAVPVTPSPGTENLTITGPGGVIDLYNELHGGDLLPPVERQCQIFADLKALLEAVLAGQPRSYIPILMEKLFGYSSPAIIQQDIDTNCATSTTSGGTTGETTGGATGGTKPTPSTGGAGAPVASIGDGILKITELLRRKQLEFLTPAQREALAKTLTNIQAASLSTTEANMAKDEITQLSTILQEIAKAGNKFQQQLDFGNKVDKVKYLSAYFGPKFNKSTIGDQLNEHLAGSQPELFDNLFKAASTGATGGAAAGDKTTTSAGTTGGATDGGKSKLAGQPLEEAIEALRSQAQSVKKDLGSKLPVAFLDLTLSQIQEADLDEQESKAAVDEIRELTEEIKQKPGMLFPLQISNFIRDEDSSYLHAYFGREFKPNSDWEDESKRLVELKPELFVPAQEAYAAAVTEAARKADDEKAAAERERDRKAREEAEARGRAAAGGGAAGGPERTPSTPPIGRDALIQELAAGNQPEIANQVRDSLIQQLAASTKQQQLVTEIEDSTKAITVRTKISQLKQQSADEKALVTLLRMKKGIE